MLLELLDIADFLQAMVDNHCDSVLIAFFFIFSTYFWEMEFVIHEVAHLRMGGLIVSARAW